MGYGFAGAGALVFAAGGAVFVCGVVAGGAALVSGAGWSGTAGLLRAGALTGAGVFGNA